MPTRVACQPPTRSDVDYAAVVEHAYHPTAGPDPDDRIAVHEGDLVHVARKKPEAEGGFWAYVEVTA